MKRIMFLMLAMSCAFSVSAQSLRIIEGAVQDKQGVAIPNAKLVVCGADQTFYANSDGKFSINVSIEAYAIIVVADGYRFKKMEIDGADMLFILKQKSVDDIAKEKEQLHKVEMRQAVARVKADEQMRIAMQKESARKAKAEQQARIAAEKEVAAKAKAEELAQITAKKELLAKNKRAEKLVVRIADNIRYSKYKEVGNPHKRYTEMGNDYAYGRNGKTANLERAFLCYNLGAQNGEKEAFLYLGHLYIKGRSFEGFVIEPDYTIALASYEKAAELNVPGAKEQIEKLLKKYRY